MGKGSNLHQERIDVYKQELTVADIYMSSKHNTQTILSLHQQQSITQLANQHMHTFNFLFITTYLKFLKTLLHVSVIRSSSGSL